MAWIALFLPLVLLGSAFVLRSWLQRRANMIVPNVLALSSLIALCAAVEIQVRLVEEPYLLQAHGEQYRRYAATVGRFLPGVGRLRSRSHQGDAWR